MDEVEIGVLEACQEYVSRQHEMLPQIAAAIGVEQSQVFYTWALRRACAQSGRLPDTDWTYFFHGYDCDLRNQNDGRRLGVYFAPKGHVGTLGSWEVLRLIMTSVAPWRDFPELRTHFANSGPPYDEHSGAWEKILPVWDRLESRGLFEQADPTLVALRATYTTRGADGLMRLCFPPEITEETRVDSAIAHRQQLSQKAVRLLLETRYRNGARTQFVTLPTAKSTPSGSHQ